MVLVIQVVTVMVMQVMVMALEHLGMARRPLLNHDLLSYHERFLSFRDDFTALCGARHQWASQMFGLADALYSFYYYNWFFDLQFVGDIESLDEEWQREDRSNAMLSVDTDCVQLLANALDHPTCPLEDLPPETKNLRERCRVQLWDDMVQRSPHVPVTSYLAYTQRINVNLCLLAWMTVNSFSVCQDVPFSMLQSVHDARCYFDSPGDQSCLQSNATDAICSHIFHSEKLAANCIVGIICHSCYVQDCVVHCQYTTD
ncbi:uncharacterized protein LOC124553333 [Schistocerca americana]|uniref:uncharacterized protein LOC124553333 n=1 Tax=Schistocerca americana TaxID=7009 RepID=UPI001F5030E6|nr:uncharacterized protein LOC124553333 [Schistocerca americana]